MDDAQQKHDAEIERWLRESVAPAFDRVMRGEGKLLDATEVFSGVEMRYRMRAARRKSMKE
jgi:hypothetical protein